MFWETIAQFFTAVTFWEAILIFIAKIIEVTLGTMRVILINKGFRKQGTFLAVVEILIWVFVASSVIQGISDAPIKGIIYSVGFALGVYIGSAIENRLAVGKILIHVVTDGEGATEISQVLRTHGHGVTSIDARGKDSNRVVLMIFANRKNRQVILKLINETRPEVLLVTNEVSVVQGGYLSPWKKFVK